MSPIHKRLKQRLNSKDKESFKKGLLAFMIDHDLDGADIKADQYHVQKVIEHAVRFSADWDGLQDNISWLSSSAYKHAKEFLGNQLREKGKYLDEKKAEYQQKLTDEKEAQRHSNQTLSLKTAKFENKSPS